MLSFVIILLDLLLLFTIRIVVIIVVVVVKLCLEFVFIYDVDACCRVYECLWNNKISYACTLSYRIVSHRIISQRNIFFNVNNSKETL